MIHRHVDRTVTAGRLAVTQLVPANRTISVIHQIADQSAWSVPTARRIELALIYAVETHACKLAVLVPTAK